jgi:hypothetical protein
LWIALVACLIAAPVHASQVSQIRVGNHPTFTRLVFELDTPTGYRVERQAAVEGGEQLVVTLDASSRTRDIQSKSAGIESVHVEEHASKAVVQIHLRKPGLPMKEMILSNPARIVLDFELPVVAAATPKQTAVVEPKATAAKPKVVEQPPQEVVAKPLPKVAPLPKPEPVAVKPKPLPKPEPVAVEPKPAPPVLAAVDSVPTADGASKSARDEQRRADLRDKIPGVHKRDEMVAQRAAKPEPVVPSDPIADAAPEAKPVRDPARRPAAQASAEKLNQEKKKDLRSAAKSAFAAKPKESPVNMAIVAAAVAGVLIVAVLVVRRIRRRSISSALEVAALAEEAELDWQPAAADASAAAQTSSNESIPVKGFSMDGDSRAIEPSLRETEQSAAAYSLSEVAVNQAQPEPGMDNEDTEGEKKMDLDASDLSVDVEPGEFNMAPPVFSGGGSDTSQLVKELAARLATLETRLDEASEARERLERQVAAQSEELRVQRAAIARTQRALRSLSRSESDQATEPALRDPAKRADSPA